MEKKIYIQDWLTLKPYEKPAKTDLYYLRICNEVKKAIETSPWSEDLKGYLEGLEINYLSCFLTSYFEDIISETNFWNAFVRLHKRLYHKQIPFYETDDYVEEEINHQDVSFLIWYFLNTIQDETLVSPYKDSIVGTAQKVMEIFETAWEEAPENEVLKQFYFIDENEDDFYVARILIDKILYDTYLFYPDTELRMEMKQMDILENKEDDEHILMFLQENRDVGIFRDHTRLLNLQGKEWAAEILCNQHELSKSFLNISRRISGLFLYKGQDDTDIFIEHIASGRSFKLTKKSFDNYASLNEEDVILYISIVQWKDEWWFSGIYFEQPFDPDVILKEKDSLQSRKQVDFLNFDHPKIELILKDQLKSFKALSGGYPIVFLRADEIDAFFKRFVKTYTDSLKLSEKELEDGRAGARNEGYFGTEQETVDYKKISSSGLVFFNPKSGLEIAMGVNSAFPLPNNPFFDASHSNEDIFSLLTSSQMSAELAMYCVDNCKDDLPFFTQGVGKAFLKDIDFLLRFWKIDNYFAEPMVTLLGLQD